MMSRQRHRGPATCSLMAASVVCLLALVSGCDQQSDTIRQLHFRIDELQAQVTKLTDQQITDAETIESLRRQIDNLQTLGPRRLEKLVTVNGIRFAKRTGGIDLDGVPGDEGVVVYLQPVDKDGSVLKAAGSARIEVFDLLASDERQLVGEYDVDVDQMAALWNDRLTVRQYTIRCGWPQGVPPEHAELTIRAEFTDYLTGRTFHAQTAVNVRLPR
jgi:FtsZ-binding cell division protein ZapB